MSKESAMKQILLFLSLFTQLCALAEYKNVGPQDDVLQEIGRLVDRATMDCARCVYDMVKHEIERALRSESSLTLYEQVMPIFAKQPMKQLVKIASAYCTSTQLYEMAAQLALQANDIDSMVVLYMVAQQKRTGCYHRSLYLLGLISGAIAAVAARMVYHDFLVCGH